jgi:hypothetical protein
MKRLRRQRGEETYKIIHDMLATKNKVCIFAEKQEQYETLQSNCGLSLCEESLNPYISCHSPFNVPCHGVTRTGGEGTGKQTENRGGNRG